MLFRTLGFVSVLISASLRAEAPVPAVAEKQETRVSQGSLSIRASAGLAWESYSLMGPSGFTAELPNRAGAVFGGEVRYQRESSPWSLGASYYHTKFEFDGYGENLTPSASKLRRNQFSLAAGLHMFRYAESSWLKELRLGLGYTVLLLNSDETTPNPVLPTQTSLGLHITSGVTHQLAEEWNFDGSVDFFLPHSFVEKTPKTGFFESAWTFGLSAIVEHHLKKGLWIGTGLRFRLEKHYFSGTGPRGSVDAVETFQGFQIPLQLRVNL